MASVDDEEEYKATRKLNGLDKDIQVGEYVRTEKGIIGKCIEEKQDRYLFDRVVIEEGYYHDYIFKDIPERANFITKHSPNIIDLIECGDYVISKDGIEGKVDFVMLPLKAFIDGEEILNDDIKSIVTKEQFNSIEYKIGE